MNVRFFLLLLLTGAGLCRAQQPMWELPASMDDGPYVYTYRGEATWGSGDSLMTDSLVWKMDISGMQDRGSVRTWIVRGFVTELAFYEPGKEPTQQTVVQTAGGTKYFLGTMALVGRMADGSDNLQGMVVASKLILDLPLASGKSFGELPMLTRSDGMYAWRVEAVRDTILIKGAAETTAQIFTVAYRALTSVQLIEWMPGPGIIRYYYHHNGSPSDVDVRLTAVSKP